MYDVTPEVRVHWHALLAEVARHSGVELTCIDHAAPKPLPDLWAREDMGIAFMCGLALAMRYPDARPLAAPVTVLADGNVPTYRSVWLVRAESEFDSLESTFGHRIGWLAEHSHSGFNAPRQALLAHRSPGRPLLYRESIGPLEHPRGALRAVADARVDVVAVDAWWWWLLQRHDPGTAIAFRTVGETRAAPIPPLVCAASCPREVEMGLSAAVLTLHEQPAVAAHLAALGVRHFANIRRQDYVELADLDRAARAAGYPLPG
jgi:ABC-type phosphate/phosphonate transport system substrate-binding protein